MAMIDFDLSGYPYAVTIEDPGYNEDGFDKAGSWLVENASALWILECDSNFVPALTYYFENEAEAVMFALRWSGKWQKK